MPLLPTRVWLEAAAAIAEESHLISAFTSALRAICSTVLAHGMILERDADQWVRVASHVPDARAAMWRGRISAIRDHDGPLVPLPDIRDPATAIVMSMAGPPAVMLVLDGEWTASRESLSATHTLAFALAAVRQREAAAQLKQMLARTYGITRRLGPTLSVEAIAQRTVTAAAKLLGASRVSLALVDPSNRALTLTAIHGLPLWLRGESVAREHSIIGRVVSSGRAIHVINATTADVTAREAGRYRTASYVIAPILAGTEIIGVVCAADKHDLRPFSDGDFAAIRMLAAGAASPLVAARTAAERDRVIHAATIDPLTKLYNRQYLDSRLQQELERSTREKTSASLLIVDVDDFKRINDTSGHQSGDCVLSCLGDIIRSAVRAIDICARYGGDEFLILMPNTDVDSAHACAKRIKALSSEHCDCNTAGRQATISVGIAVSEPGDDAAALFARADKALYAAKAAGKNRIAVHPSAAPPERINRKPAYVLIADPKVDRLPQYVEWVGPFHTGLLVARSGHEALTIIERFGEPALLIVDLGSPDMAGQALLDRLSGTGTGIVAWSERPAAAGRNAERVVHLSADAPMLMARRAAQELLRATPGVEAPDLTQPAIDRELGEMAEKMRELVTPANVAIYVPTPDGQHFRVASTWASGPPPSTARYDLRGIFAQVRERRDLVSSGDAHFISDEAAEPGAGGSPGLVALPIIRSGELSAVACIHSVSGLVLRRRTVRAIKAIAAQEEHVVTLTTQPKDEGNRATRLQDDRRQLSMERVETPLTLLERQPGELVAMRELARARRENTQLSVVLFELAQRSPVGPTMPSGDTLEPVVDTFLKAVRQSDLPIRWGFNELLLILPGLAGPEARSVAARVSAAMQAGARHAVAVAGGVAEADPAVRQFDEVVREARARVAMAVDRGHNRVH